ncbi:MAG: hypothetical protein JWO54_608 [Candidatus Saccharibacteria bacterium]|nr:hypothetical protein [Candidatus Saccharibacteria bacterium]MDB5180848.1 hypothetical protein [Candidatus Saccharibacteria bacterium]
MFENGFGKKIEAHELNEQEKAEYDLLHPQEQAPVGYAAVYVRNYATGGDFLIPNKHNEYSQSETYVVKKRGFTPHFEVTVANEDIIPITTRTITKTLFSSNARFKAATLQAIHESLADLAAYVDAQNVPADLEHTYRDTTRFMER